MRSYRRSYASFFALLFVTLLLTGCATTGIPKPQSLDQKIAYAEGMVTSVKAANAASLNAHEISSDAAEHIQKSSDDAWLFIVAAKQAAFVGDVTTAEGQVALATSLLQQLLDYLRAAKGH